jgi:hypothetical protein
MTPALSLVLVVMITALMGCASSPDTPTTAPILFAKPMTEVHKAALNALAVTGFDVEKSEPTYVQGFRPRKFGLFVGSGGETVGVWLEPVSPSRTAVRVDTTRSFAGFAGQKVWDKEIVGELEKSLGKPE